MPTNFSTDTNYVPGTLNSEWNIRPIEVVLNVDEVLAQIKDGVAEMVKAEVDARLADEVRRIIADLPTPPAPKRNPHTAYILNVLSTLKCSDTNNKVKLQNNDLTVYLSGAEIRNAMEEQGIWHDNF